MSSRFPLLFNLSDLKGVVVSSFFYFPSEWNLHLRMNLRGPEIQEYTDFSAIVQQLQPSVTRRDYRTRNIPPSGTFSVSSFFFAISSNPVAPLFPYKSIWFFLSPFKVQGFLWKIAWDRGRTLDLINPFSLTTPFYLALTPSTFQRKNPMNIYSFTASSVRDCEANSSSF